MSKILRTVVIILMGLTATFTLLGSIGSICISWFPENYGFDAIVPYRHIYQIATIFTFVAAGTGLAATVALARGRRWGYKGALFALLLGLATAGTKMYYSSFLRGSTAPTNIRFSLTTITLLVFLLLRIPPIWRKVKLFRVDGDGASSDGIVSGAAMLLSGLITLTTPLWAGPTHTINGYNLVYLLKLPLLIGGGILVLAGIAHLTRAARADSHPHTVAGQKAHLPI